MLRFAFICLSISDLMTGCAIAPEIDDPVPRGDDGSPVSEISSTLCTDNGAADFSAAIGNLSGDTVSHTSPSRTYGSTACQDQYVVEASNTLNKTLSLDATWGEGLPTTKQSCPFALLSATAYGQQPNGQWIQLGNQAVGGEWIDFFGGGFCTIDAHFSVSNPPYSKIRIAAKAAAFAIFFTDPRKVSASIKIPVVLR